MREHPDAIVVGGGISGASILFHLARAGVRATLLEADALASGPTGRSSAAVRLHYTMPELAELARRGHAFFAHFHDETGADVDFRQIGVAYAVGAHDAPLWRANVDRLRSLGFGIEILTADDVARSVPGFDLTDVALVVYEPASGYADPVRATVGLAAGARRLGCVVREGCRVAQIVAAAGRVQGVVTDDGTMFAADRVVVAAGPWTRALIAGVGVELPLHIERQPITIVGAPEGGAAVVPWIWGDFVDGFYARPAGAHEVLIGCERPGPDLASPEDLDPTVSTAEAAAMVASAARRVPALAGREMTRGYAAMYDVAPDRLHIIDTVPGIDGLFVVAGTSGHGFKLAPAIGEQVAQMVTGRTAELLEPFRIDRVYDVARERSR